MNEEHILTLIKITKQTLDLLEMEVKEDLTPNELLIDYAIEKLNWIKEDMKGE